jgi:MSHA biogenesis protein MshN
MSVVNKMLQDLESRQATPEAISADYLPPPKSSRKIWYILLIILVFAVTSYLWFMLPQWTKSGSVPLNKIELKPQLSQMNSESEQTEAESKHSTEVTTGILDIAPANKIEENLDDKESTTESVVTSADAPIKTSETLSVTEPKALNYVANSNSSQSTELRRDQVLGQATNMLENVVKKEDKESTQSETRFSISDSSEKDKAIGAKQKVISALSEGNNELAILRLEELLQVQPDNVEASKKLAALLFAQKRSNEAKYVLQQSMDNHPRRSDLRLMLARLYMQKNDSTAAIKLLNEVQPDAVNQLDFLAYRAALLQQNGSHQQAKDDYLQLIEVDRVNAKWWLGLAITQDRLGQTKEALVAYQTAYSKAQLSPSVVKFVKQRMIQIEGAQ